jgi:O-antigen/teichoic acid export membrane protein
VDTGLTIAAGILNAAYVRRRLGVRPRARRFEAGFLRELVAYSSLIFVNMLVDQVYWRLGHLVLGATAGAAAVAVFAVAMQIASYYKQFPLAISGVYFPRVNALVVGGATPAALLAVFVGAARLQLVVLGLVFGGFVLVGRSFVELWAGPEYALAWQVALVVIVPLTVHLAQAVGLHILQAKNRYGFACAVYLAAAALNLGLSLVLVPRWGATGAAAATATSLTAGNIVAITWYHHRRVGLDMWRFFRSLWSGIGPAAALAILAGALALPLVPGASWATLAARVAAFTALYAASMWALGLDARERELVRTALARVLRRGGAAAAGE